MRNNIIAIMYDFDKTLSTRDMQEYTFIPNLGISADEFWNEAGKLRENYDMDQVLCYMYLMLKKTLDNNQTLKRSYLNEMGVNIELFPGIIEWFDRINEYGKQFGFKIEHYIISSGLKEIIEGSKIGDKFTKIYASEYLYDESGNATFPKLAINYTNKTQYLARINKGILEIIEDDKLNDKMQDEKRRIPTSNMIYIGDGYTDVPCMKLTKDHNGISIAVYTEKNKKMAKKLLEDGRINFMTPADYRENSEIDLIVKKTIKKMVLDTELKNISYEQVEK